MRRILVLFFFALLATSLSAQLATPSVLLGSGSYINSVYDPINNTISGATTCWSTNGVTPTATTAGTCDAGFFSSVNQAGCYLSATGTCKYIATKSGSTNSTVGSSSYTITSLAITTPVSAITPSKVTAATTNTIDELPCAVNANGTIYLFYSEGTSGLTIDNDGTARVMFKTTTNGSSFSTPTSTTFCQSGDPANGCLFNGNTAWGQIAAGCGVTTSGTVEVFITTWSNNLTQVNGLYECRLPSAGSWNCFVVTTPSYPATNTFQNATTNLISIAAGESGTSGTCFTSGCVAISVRIGSGATYYLLLSNNDGQTWNDPITVSVSCSSGGGGCNFPYITEEHATIRIPNTMEMIWISRPSTDAEINGGPTPLVFAATSNFLNGAPWNNVFASGAYFGNATNWPLSKCSVSQGTNWTDTWTQPSVVQNPRNPLLYTVLAGERYLCNGTTINQWQSATFSATSAYANNGLNLPAPQVVNFNAGPCPTNSGSPHTTYSRLAALNSTQNLMFYECGTSAPLSDIYVTTLSYPSGTLANGGLKWTGGTALTSELLFFGFTLESGAGLLELETALGFMETE